MGNSSLVTYTKISPNSTNPRNHVIDTITIHHTAGVGSAAGIASIFASTDRQASCNYAIGNDGSIALVVDEANRSWCSSNRENDHRAITIEVSNSSTGGDWPVSDKAMQSLIALCVDICKRNNIKKLNYTGDKTGNLTMHKWFAATSCVPTFTEVLTRNGWKRIDEILFGEEIACADINELNITFEPVYAKVPIKRQDTYTNNDFTATKDHRMLYRSQYSSVWKIDEYKNILNTGYYIPLAGRSNFKGLVMSNIMLRFLIATQADGHYMYDKRSDGSNGYYGLEFHLKKERKINAIKEILISLDLKFVENQKSDGSVSIRVYNQNDINIVEDICEKYLTNKNFNWEWINMTPDQAQLFLSEILLWDGCIAGKKYTSADKINRDIVNAIAAINNVGSRVRGNDVSFRDTPYVTMNGETRRNNQTIKKNAELTEVTCVSVKTGVFLCRQNGKTFIIGNCPGPYLGAKFPWIAEQVNKQLGVTEEKPAAQTCEFKVGDEVKLVSGATYYNGGAIPGFVFNSKLYVRAISGDNITISTLKTGAITGIVKAKSLEAAVSNANSSTTITNEFAVGAEVKLVSGAKYTSGKAIPDFVFKSKLYVRAINGNNITISTLKTGAITGIVDKKYLTSAVTASSYLVQVTATALNIRAGAGTNYGITGCIKDKGIYTIVEENNGWGKLKSGQGWICLSYTKKV